MKLRILIAISSLLLSSACATMPGGVSMSESKATGTKALRMEPGWLVNGASLKLALWKSLDVDDDKMILTAIVMPVDNIDTKDSLIINVDGKTTRLSSIDDRTDLGTLGQGSKRYAVTEGLIKEMLAGKKVYVRINHFKTYSEAEFASGMTTAKDGFAKFMAELEKVRQTKK